MGISTVTAARIFAGQAAGATGEEYDLAFDQFPHLALIKTYNTDAQVPDSAGTITAITTGEKTRIGVLGVNSNVERDDCAGALTNTLADSGRTCGTRVCRQVLCRQRALPMPHLPGLMLIVPIETGKAARRLRTRPRHLDAGISLYSL